MIRTDSLVVGRVYFMVTYKDAGHGRPIIISYQYLGKDINGEPVGPPESGYHFKFLAPFNYCELETEPDPCNTRHWFSEEQLSGLSDLDGLVEELSGLREQWQQCGQS
jgi:hypothetical protein